MMMLTPRLLTICAAVIALVVASGSSAAQESGLRANIVSVSDGHFPEAKVVLNVEDDSAEGLPPLSPEDFSVTLNGAAASVTAAELASSQNEPLDLLLVLDVSGSMAGAAMQSAKDAAKALVLELAPNDRVAVISFSDQVTLVQPFTADRALVTTAIDGLVAQGNTALYQATAVSALEVVASPATRKAVVLLSDGADFGGASVATREDALGAAQSVGVPYFTVAQGSDLDLPYLQQLADVTKGRLLQAPNPQNLRNLYMSIGRLLRNQYVVTFDARSVATLSDVAVRVEVRSGERVAASEARYTPAPGFAPPVEVSGIEPDETIDGMRKVHVSVAGDPVVARVALFIDDALVTEASTAPYVFDVDPAALSHGAHTLRIVVDLGGQPLETAIPFSYEPVPGATGGGIPLPLPVLAVVGAAVLVALLVALYVFIRGRMRRSAAIGPVPVGQRTIPWAQQVILRAPEMPRLHEPEEEPAVEQEDIGEPLGLLISRSGPDLGREYDVGGTPISIGSAARCGVRIDDPDLSAEEARIWIRGGRLMLHKFTRLSALANDGTVGGWMILDPGDTFEIGQHTFEFRMLKQPSPSPGVDGEAPVSAPPPGGTMPSFSPGRTAEPSWSDVPNVLRERSEPTSETQDVPNVLRDRGAADEAGTTPATRLTDMMPPDSIRPAEDDDLEYSA